MMTTPRIKAEPEGRHAPLLRSISWYSRPVEDVLAELVSTVEGLSAPEASRRLASNGLNELKEIPPIHPLRILLRQFKSLLIWVLVAAAVIAGLLGEGLDCIVILVIIVFNAAIGFYQEFQAERSIAALKQLTAPQATVRRDGHAISIPASGIVKGDILALEAGDLVAADARLLASASLRCVEALLTGESEAVSKQVVTLGMGEVALGDRENMVFMGTSIAGGTALAVVVATAMDTELGRIAGLMEVATSNDKTPLQKKLDSFGRVLVWATLGVVVLLFVLGWMRDTPFLELLMTSISLAVAAVPEGLPAIVTVALALGVVRMARRGALVRRLPAVETLGSATVICTDKTGTLTLGEMTVRALYVADDCYDVTGEGYSPGGEIRIAGKKPEGDQAASLSVLATVMLGCNNAHLVQEGESWRVLGDPTEGALLVAGIKAGANLDRIDQEMPRYHELPFDSDRKRSTVIRKIPDGLRAFVNGAPGVLLKLCTRIHTSTGIRSMTDEDRTRILAETSSMAQRALRVIGSAYRDIDMICPADLNAQSVERELVFVGLSGLYDPPRPEGKMAVAQCLSAGIRVVMITGDHPETAIAIARELGLASNDDVAVSGLELDEMTEDELRQRIPGISVYARVSAEHKLRVVRAWKANDAVVAMTGDGVNDAPAMKGADIGIAMGKSGTEVTKQASDMIITDDHFDSIVTAVEEGRGIYDNIQKTLQYLLSGNVGELLLMALCVFVGFPAPLLPIHLLWINLVTDGLPALCLASDAIDPDVMMRSPRARSERIIDRGFILRMGLTGFLTAGVAFYVYLYGLLVRNPDWARTGAFTVLVFAELLRALGARSETKPLWSIRWFSNIPLLVVVLGSIGLQIWSLQGNALGRFLKTSTIPISDVFWLLSLGSVPLLALELIKAIRNSRAGSTLAGIPLQPSESE